MHSAVLSNHHRITSLLQHHGCSNVFRLNTGTFEMEEWHWHSRRLWYIYVGCTWCNIDIYMYCKRTNCFMLFTVIFCLLVCRYKFLPTVTVEKTYCNKCYWWYWKYGKIMWGFNSINTSQLLIAADIFVLLNWSYGKGDWKCLTWNGTTKAKILQNNCCAIAAVL